jgi:hypothetical protein
MVRRTIGFVAAAFLFASLVGCPAKEESPAAKLQKAKEQVIRAKTKEERVAAQEVLKRLQLQQGTGFQSQSTN